MRNRRFMPPLALEGCVVKVVAHSTSYDASAALNARLVSLGAVVSSKFVKRLTHVVVCSDVHENALTDSAVLADVYERAKKVSFFASERAWSAICIHKYCTNNYTSF